MKRYIAVLVACLLALSGCAESREPIADSEPEKIPVQEAPESVPDPVPEPEPKVEVEPVDLSQLTMPPKLTVICGGEELPASNCGCMWVTEHGILCADAPTPLQLKQNLKAQCFLEDQEK